MEKFVFLVILTCSAISIVLAKNQGIAFLEDLNKDERIIQGSPAAQNQFPHQALLSIVNAEGNWFRCGGALISTRWVLTAGHCLRTKVRVNVHLGSVDSSTPLIKINGITSFYFLVNTTTNHNDVGVINLGRDVPISASVKPIRLPRRSQLHELFADKVSTLIGWGYTHNVAPNSNVLNFVQMKVVTNQQCSEHFGITIKVSNICAIGIKSLAQGACFGDSGSPLFLREADGLNTLIGVTSFVSSRGCDANYPTAFARTTSYLEWISQTTGIAIKP